jgi:hypothetical protein
VLADKNFRLAAGVVLPDYFPCVAIEVGRDGEAALATQLYRY